MQASWSVRSTDGTRIDAFELGGGECPEALVIAHATGLHGPMYARLGKLLANRLRVVAFDFRGHGTSGAPSSPAAYEWERLADDLLAVRLRLGDGAVHGFGHSLGASILLLAERRVAGAFTSLSLFEPIVYPEGDQAIAQFELGARTRRRRAEFDSRADALARFAGRPPFDAIRAGPLRDYVEHGFDELTGGGVRLRCEPEHEALSFEAGSRCRLDDIDAIAAPTLVGMSGDAGEGAPRRLAVGVAERLASTVAQYPHLDHFGPFQDPVSIAADIADHVAARRRGA